MFPSTCGARPFIVKSWPVIMKILTVHNKIQTCHHENLDVPSRKSRPLIVKARPVIIKIPPVHNKVSTCHHKNHDRSQQNLDLPSWKFQPFVTKSRLVITKISNVHNNKISNCHHENKYQLLAEMAFLNIVKFLKLKLRVITCRSCFIFRYIKKLLVSRTQFSFSKKCKDPPLHTSWFLGKHLGIGSMETKLKMLYSTVVKGTARLKVKSVLQFSR